MGNERNVKYVCTEVCTEVGADDGYILKVIPAGKEVITLTSIGEGRFLTETKRVPSYNS